MLGGSAGSERRNGRQLPGPLEEHIMSTPEWDGSDVPIDEPLYQMGASTPERIDVEVKPRTPEGKATLTIVIASGAGDDAVKRAIEGALPGWLVMRRERYDDIEVKAIEGPAQRASTTPEDAANAMWPVIVGGRFADVVEAFRRYGDGRTAAEREACAKDIDAFIAEERKSEEAATFGSGHHATARAMRKAYERASAAVRARK